MFPGISLGLWRETLETVQSGRPREGGEQGAEEEGAQGDPSLYGLRAL